MVGPYMSMLSALSTVGAAPSYKPTSSKRRVTMKSFMEDIAPSMEYPQREQLKDAYSNRNEAIKSNKRWVNATGKTLSSNDRSQAMRTKEIQELVAKVDDDLELDM